eukprot:2846326-Amphidinium_carterae.2
MAEQGFMLVDSDHDIQQRYREEWNDLRNHLLAECILECRRLRKEAEVAFHEVKVATTQSALRYEENASGCENLLQLQYASAHREEIEEICSKRSSTLHANIEHSEQVFNKM